MKSKDLGAIGLFVMEVEVGSKCSESNFFAGESRFSKLWILGLIGCPLRLITSNVRPMLTLMNILYPRPLPTILEYSEIILLSARLHKYNLIVSTLIAEHKIIHLNSTISSRLLILGMDELPIDADTNLARVVGPGEGDYLLDSIDEEFIRVFDL